MQAFLSHSSKDKGFVSQVAANMDPLQYELDEQTFEYILNAQAIRNGLKRCSLVVFFLSSNSVRSAFIKEEQRQTQEALARGGIRKVIVFSLDGLTHEHLPDWLQENNIVQRISSAKACARRIQSALIEIGLSDNPELLYLGRDEDEKSLRQALAKPSAQAPIALHIVGFHGIGRRTFLQKSLSKFFPRFYSVFISLTVSQYQGIEELYRAVYGLHIVASTQTKIEDFISFGALSRDLQVEAIAIMIREMANAGEFLIVFDDGNGVLEDSGHLQQHWMELIEALQALNRPVLAFIQTRMQPYRLRAETSKTYHQKLDAISIPDSREIISFSLKQTNTEFEEAGLTQLSELASGHPYNIRFAAGLASTYGVEPFLAQPGHFIAWREKRGEDFLSEITFDETEQEIIATLIDYRYLATDAMVAILEAEPSVTLEALRNLQDFCCVEFRDGFFHLAAPIREAARRDKRFARSEDWRRQVAEKVATAVGEYTPEDDIPLNLVQTAAMAAIRGGAAPDLIRSLILPSHLLVVAREHYDAGRRSQCISTCKQAYELRSRMTSDAAVETLRLWALSATRLRNPQEFQAAIDYLQTRTDASATRVRLFIEGFKARLEGRADVAEDKFLSAWRLSETNASINRELAKLYCGQRRYAEAERFARQAYATSPTNPFVLDIMLETLLGKITLGLRVDQSEVNSITEGLQTHGNAPGFSFFTNRKAQNLINARRYADAIIAAEESIAKTPNLLAPYFLKLDAESRAGYLSQADKTIKTITELLDTLGASEGEVCYLAEAEANLLIEKRQYSAAKVKLDTDRRIPDKPKIRLYSYLVKAVAFSPEDATGELRDWAKKFSH